MFFKPLVFCAVLVTVGGMPAWAQMSPRSTAPPQDPPGRSAVAAGQTTGQAISSAPTPERTPLFQIGNVPVTVWAPVQPVYDANLNHNGAANGLWEFDTLPVPPVF